MNITDLTGTIWIMKETISHHDYAQYNLTGKISAETTDGYKEVVAENGETAKNFILGFGTYNSASIFYINGAQGNRPYFYFLRTASMQPEAWNYSKNSLSYLVTGSVTIEITGGADAQNTELINWFIANGDLMAYEIDLSEMSEWNSLAGGNHTLYIVAKGKDGYANSSPSVSVGIRKPIYYNISISLSHIDYRGPSGPMKDNDTRAITLTAQSGYVLPRDIGNIENVTWNYERDGDGKNATLTLKNPTGDVTCEINGIAEEPKLSTPIIIETNDTNVVFSSDDNATSYEVFWLDGSHQYSIGETSGEPAGGYKITSIATFDGPIYVQHSDGTIETIRNINPSTVIDDVIKMASPTNLYVGIRYGETIRGVQGGYDSSTNSMTEEAYTLESDILMYDYLPAECIDENTMITMYDGTKKMMKNINVGDIVMSIDFDNMCLVGRKVIYSSKDDADYDKWVVPVHYKYTFSDGTVIRRAMRHRFYNLESSSYKHLTLWDIEEHAYSISGENPELIKIDIIQSPLHYARITLEESNNYFANGLSTGDSECPSGIVLNKKLRKG